MNITPQEIERLMEEYGALLERIKEAGEVVCDEGLLPAGKDRLEEILLAFLKLVRDDAETTERLKAAYLSLAIFLPGVRKGEARLDSGFDPEDEESLATLARHRQHMLKSDEERARLERELAATGL